MRKVLFAVTLLAGLAGNVLAQTGNASLGGIVEDPSKALIPGVTITAKNVDTAVTTTQITNESGVYNFPVLQPGSYEISAELPGFKKGVQRAELPYAGQVRVNFTLEVGQTSETVEVTVSAEASLKESSASISDVLTQKKIETMPMVGNNVLDLLTSLPGLAISQTGNTALDTVNGLNLDSINVTRDGLSINDGRYAAGSTSGGTAIGGKGRNLLSDTTLLPDLIGEVRLVLSPVDAELGRGNAQIQIRTRSGTNKFNGSAAWYTRNSALDANSWLNNHTPFTDTATGVISNSTQKPWRNNNQYTVAYGGPVKIPHVYDGHNKTFFYSLWEQNISSTRQIVYTNVLTDTARLGVFRYFPYWSPEGYLVNSTITNQKVPVTASTASWVAVDVAGNPVAPPAMPDGSAYPYKLTCFSVFGNKRLDNSGALVPFTAADCPGGTAILPQSSPSANGLWDVYRSTFDSTGFIKRLLTQMPRANFFGQLDGLNLAQYGFMQRRKGSTSSATAQQTTDPYANNKQINIKIDHNFNANHKAAFNYTRQRDSSDGNVSSWPDGPAGIVVRRPDVFTANVTSTLSSHIINQATFGMNRNFNSTLPAYLSTDPEMKKLGEQYLIPGGKSVLNPSYSYLVRVASSSGRVGSGTGPLNGAGVPTSSTSWTSSILYSYGDTVSWSRGKHAFKFGAELRMPQNAGNGGNDPYPSISLGNNGSATQTVSPFGTTTNFPELLGLQSNSLVTGANPRSDVTNLLYFLNGSVNTATQFYYINNYLDLKNNRWQDYSTSGIRMRNQIHREWSAFAKDDYKVTRRLTLNLGVRWEFYASPYIEGGFTSTVIGGGYGAFGAARTVQGSLEQFNQNPFALWLHPGNLFMTGYGSNPFAAGLLPEDCKVGVQQTGLPKSTCDPNSLSSIQFVGPGSPNPDLKAIPEQYHNFGPAIGFAYTLPWFGEGKTTIRGGYQQTFQRVLVNNSGEANGTDTFIGQIPGSQRSETTNVNDAVFQAIINPTGGTGRALTLADFANLVPVRPQVNPGGVLPLGARAQNIAGIYDSNYKGPYTQNIVLSVTRQINPKFTADVRYTGTLGRRLDGGVNLDTPNVYHNPELLQALLDARAGTCTANAAGYKSYIDSGINPCDINGDPVLLDQMFAGLNLNPNVNGAAGTGTFGNVGTVNAAGVFQSGAAHLRRSSTFQTNLANGDFNQLFTAVTGNLLTLLPTGLRNLPNDPSTGLGYFTVTPSMRTLRNGCDRLGDGFTIVQQNTPGATQNANTGAPIPLRCFPEDYVITNSQFSGVTYHANWNNSYYHSLQTQLTARPVDGVSIQATWVWSKLMGTGGTYVDPVNRQLNYYAQANNPQAIRMNGTIELPLGPNKLFFNNASGWIARAIEKWQTSFIFNGVTSGLSSALPQTNHFYGNPGYTIASPNWKLPEAHLDWSSGSGTIFGNAFTSATDPQCVDRSQVTAGDKMGTSLQSACTLLAVAQRNSDGTPGDVMLKYTKPGEVGNLGFGNFKSFGQWTLDMSASKTFSAGESRSFQIRVDATNVLNHPLSAAPSFQAGTFGVINAIGGVNKTGERAFQGQLRVNF